MIDACAFVGHWPFRKLRRGSMADLIAHNEKNGIQSAVISNLDSIFYNDPMEGDEALARELPEGYLLALSHNPMLPYAVRDVTENRLNAAAVRLYPSYHGYSLEDPTVTALCQAAASAGLVIYIVHKLDDVRMDYLFKQQLASIDSVLSLAQAVPEGRFVLSGLGVHEAIAHAAKLTPQGNLFIDTAYLGSLSFPLENLCDAFPHQRILFSTHQPLLCPEVGVQTATYATLPLGVKERILRLNADELFHCQ